MKHYVCIQIYESDLPVPSLYFSWYKESRCVSEPSEKEIEEIKDKSGFFPF